jgi:hypothetical protein
MTHIATAFNASMASGRGTWFVFKNEQLILGYGFDVELVTKFPTSMHGSSEGHQCYVYRRTAMPSAADAVPVDAAFEPGISALREVQRAAVPAASYTRFIDNALDSHRSLGRTRGQRKRAARCHVVGAT